MIKKASLFLLSFGVLLLICEVVFRVAGYDFSGEVETWHRMPPFYRQPTVPTGDVFFRRPGPETWSGPVISTYLDLLGVDPEPYRDEPAITVEYDEMGFRNPPGLSRWEIAVAGDSFTELGNLPQEELFTSLLAERLGVSVLNLGTSYTGPWTHLDYLESFGLAPSTRLSVVVFFEGNDLRDLLREEVAVERWQLRGERPYREIKAQTSATRALVDAVGRLARGWSKAPEDPVNAFFLGPDGEVPITVRYTPPSGSQMSKRTSRLFRDFLLAYAAYGSENRIETWLAFMPVKQRVLAGRIRYPESAPADLAAWTPTDLPQWVAELCKAYGVHFVDLTPALAAETRTTGHLLYNGLYDTHLNAAGSRVVARRLAEVLKDSVTSEPPRRKEIPDRFREESVPSQLHPHSRNAGKPPGS